MLYCDWYSYFLVNGSNMDGWHSINIPDLGSQTSGYLIIQVCDTQLNHLGTLPLVEHFCALKYPTTWYSLIVLSLENLWFTFQQSFLHYLGFISRKVHIWRASHVSEWKQLHLASGCQMWQLEIWSEWIHINYHVWGMYLFVFISRSTISHELWCVHRVSEQDGVSNFIFFVS